MEPYIDRNGMMTALALHACSLHSAEHNVSLALSHNAFIFCELYPIPKKKTRGRTLNMVDTCISEGVQHFLPIGRYFRLDPEGYT